jgi:hypothetical protein
MECPRSIPLWEWHFLFRIALLRELYTGEFFSCMIHVPEGGDVEEVCRWLYSTCAVIAESYPGIGDVSSKGSSRRQGQLLSFFCAQVPGVVSAWRRCKLESLSTFMLYSFLERSKKISSHNQHTSLNIVIKRRLVLAQTWAVIRHDTTRKWIHTETNKRRNGRIT